MFASRELRLFEIQKYERKSVLVAISLYMAGASALGATADAPPDAVLSDVSLFSAPPLVKPNMVLDLSVELPTTGAAYRNEAFDIRKTYIGYWDPMGCYDYSSAKGYFERAASATVSTGQIVCSNKWSGNMLNWAASSAIDMLRYAMTGGDRFIDDEDSTVLQRAVLRADFYNHKERFPARHLTGNLRRLTPLVAEGVVENGGTIHIANCDERVFIGSASAGNCSAPGANQQFGPGKQSAPYFARVQVCDSIEGALRNDLCQKYPNGKYKPVGSIQRHAEKMRFAAFGYLMGQDNARYGGVLRAPMKFVGPKAESARLQKVVNEAPEWDENTGIFLADPLKSPQRSSGVVNYVNKFGRTDAPGNYKSLDPVGELYYESLRYLQGQAPTPGASNGASDVALDGFPIYNQTEKWGAGKQSAWDPVSASCQRNYVLVIGDQNSHHDQSLPGLTTDGLDGWAGVRHPNGSEPDTAYWSRIVGAFEEGNETVTYPDPSGGRQRSTRGNSGGPRSHVYVQGSNSDALRNGAQIASSNFSSLETGADRGSLGWAALAYWANTQKIRDDHPAVRVKTFTIDVNEGGDGTVRAPQRGSSFYLAAKYGGFDDRNNDGNPFVTARGSDGPEYSSNTEWQTGFDDDGYPKPSGYFLGGRPEEMIGGIRKIFANAGSAAGSFSGGAVSSSLVASNGSTVYVPQMDSARWSGSVLAYELSHDAERGAISQVTAPLWNAADRLTGNALATPPIPVRDPDGRNIFTLLDSTGTGAVFSWDSLKNDSVLKGHLNTEPYSQPAALDDLGQSRVEYLRGDRSKEADRSDGIFRTRDSVMGDVANSAPLLVSSGGTQAVYVGANDGMFHAFDADTGDELFAYVPRALFPKLGAYTSQEYVHQPYADGSAAAVEVELANGTRKTALVSGMGAGATGVFALDISRPAGFSANHVMWEFTGKDDADMGHVTQAPRILRFRTAAATRNSPAVYRWFAVVPSGFNNGNPGKAAALYLLSLDKVSNEPWQLGTNYYKIVLPSPADKTVVNALGPVGDYNSSDNAARWLYAGDTQGNLWKFDFTKNAPWSASAGDDSALALNGAPLMVAKDGSGKRQPITVAPEVGVGPNGGAIVLFGTGKFVEVDDLSSRNVQTLYGVYDSGTAIPAGETRTQLEARKVDSDVADPSQFIVSGDAFVYGSYDSSTSHRRGWYFDLPDAESQGERQVSQMVLSDGYLLFNTLIPNANACGAGGGGHSCAVNAMTGLSSGSTCIPSTVGLLGAPLVIQGEGAFSSTDSLGRRVERKRVSVVNLGPGMGKGPGTSLVNPIAGGTVSQLGGRLNWREVINFKELNQ